MSHLGYIQFKSPDSKILPNQREIVKVTIKPEVLTHKDWTFSVFCAEDSHPCASCVVFLMGHGTSVSLLKPH